MSLPIQLTLVMISLLILPQAALAEVYRCARNGTVVFSDSPCGEDSQVIKNIESTPADKKKKSAPSRDFQKKQNIKALQTSNRRSELQRRIRDLGWQIGDQQQELQTQIDEMEKEMLSLVPNDDDDDDELRVQDLKQQLEQQITQTRKRGNEQIQRLQQQRQNLQDELDSLNR